MIRAKDLMTKRILTTGVGTSFSKVLDVFTEMGISHLPIVNDDDKLIAMLSSTDALEAMHDTDEAMAHYEGISIQQRIDITQEMSDKLVFVTPQSSIKHIIKVMVEHDIHAVPVVENEKLVGILAADDILKAIYRGTLKLSDGSDYSIVY